MRLDIHGIGIEIESDYTSVVEDAAHDFNYFVVETVPTLNLRVRVVSDARPAQHWRQWLRFRGSSLFRSASGERRVCFFDQAWVRYHFNDGLCDIYCEDEKISYEVCYLALLSFIGESLDRRGWHRLHGFGFGKEGWGGVVLAASGTGKSTLAIRLITQPGWQILSDDTPLVNHRAKLRSFPQRIALKERPAIDHSYIRQFSRVKHGEKFVVGSDFFKDRIPTELPARWLVFAKRDPKRKGGLRPLARWKAVWPLVKWLVVGYETPQIWQLYLRFNWTDIHAKSRILFSRIKVMSSLLKSCRLVELNLAHGPDRSCQEFMQFFKLGAGAEA